MARKRKIRVGMLNIVTHPHSAESYLQLFDDSIKVDVRMGGDLRARISSVAPMGSDPLDGIQGYIFRSTKLDLDSPALDMKSGKAIDPEELKGLLPEDVQPNLAMIWFNFFPKSHRLVFDMEPTNPKTGKKISFAASTAQLFFQKAFNAIQHKTKFNTIKVTIIQNHETLRKIFLLPRLKRLEIYIDRPNPTDGPFETQLDRQLEEENTDTYKQEQTSSHREGLQPSDRTKALAHLATANGYVKAKGNNQAGKLVTLKTTDKPVEMVVNYDKNQGFGNAFSEAASRLVSAYRPE